MGVLSALLPMVLGQLGKADNGSVVTALSIVNNWTAACLEDNRAECDAIVNNAIRAGLSADLGKIATTVYDKCNPVTIGN